MRTEKPTAILSGDIHLRDDQPECRTDNYWKAQETKVHFLRELQESNNNIPLLVAGDLFDKWNPSYELVTWAIENLPRYLVTVAGNHDLKNNSIALFRKTALAVLGASSRVFALYQGGTHDIAHSTHPLVRVYGFSLGEEARRGRRGSREVRSRIALVHDMVWQSKKPYPGAPPSGEASRYLKEHEGFDLVLTGDNHKCFTQKIGDTNRLLVNTGSMMRMSADQSAYEPCVFLWYAEANEVEAVPLPIERGVVSREHIEKKKRHDDRVEAYVDRLREDVEIGLDFRQNMKEYLGSHRVRKGVREVIGEAME